jgi:hypothetical protein
MTRGAHERTPLTRRRLGPDRDHDHARAPAPTKPQPASRAAPNGWLASWTFVGDNDRIFP